MFVNIDSSVLKHFLHAKHFFFIYLARLLAHLNTKCFIVRPFKTITSPMGKYVSNCNRFPDTELLFITHCIYVLP